MVKTSVARRDMRTMLENRTSMERTMRKICILLFFFGSWNAILIVVVCCVTIDGLG